MKVIRHIGMPWLLLGRTVRASTMSPVSARECLAQLYDMANRSVALVCGGMAFFGAVMVTIANEQARKFTGNLSFIGPAYFELLIRELGPMTSAFLAASRIGAGHSAELALMTVNEQVEALEMCATDPLTELVAPRAIAGLIAFPSLYVIGTTVAAVAASLTAWSFGADPWAFASPQNIDAGDLVAGFSKSISCGLYVPLAAAATGLSARGGAAAVGAATSVGVVRACLGCLTLMLIFDLTAFVMP